MATDGEILLGVSCCDDMRGYIDVTVFFGGVCILEPAELVLNLDSKYKEGITANIQTKTNEMKEEEGVRGMGSQAKAKIRHGKP